VPVPSRLLRFDLGQVPGKSVECPALFIRVGDAGGDVKRLPVHRRRFLVPSHDPQGQRKFVARLGLHVALTGVGARLLQERMGLAAVRPQFVHQLLHRDQPASIHDEHRQDKLLLGCSEVQTLTLGAYCEATQDANFHEGRSVFRRINQSHPNFSDEGRGSLP
jgi:hypothetical protein